VPYLTDADVSRAPWLLDDLDGLEHLLYVQEGVVSVRQAMRHRTRSAIRHQLFQWIWRREHRNVLIAHNGPLTDRQRLWVAKLAAGEGSVLGGRSALAVLGLKGFASAWVDVLVGPGHQHSRPPNGVRVHRTVHLPPDDVHSRERPPCTKAARSVVDAASWARSDREAMTVVAMSFQQRLVGLDEVREVLHRMPRAKRRCLTWTTAADAAGGAESLGELDLISLLRRAGLPLPSRQAVRTDARGRKRYLDALFDEWGLHVEIDGAHHLDPEQAWADADRQNQLWLAGEVLLRFPAWVVRHEPGRVAADIRRALMELGWRPEQIL
jgi:hypothetical protein